MVLPNFTRQARQLKIDGLDQKKLASTRIGLVSDLVSGLAELVVYALAAMGMSENGFLHHYESNKFSKQSYFNVQSPHPEEFSKMLQVFSPSTNYRHIPQPLDGNLHLAFPPDKFDLLIDLRSGLNEKLQLTDYARNKGMKLIDASSKDSKFAVRYADRRTTAEEGMFGVSGPGQDPITDLILTGIISELARKAISPYSSTDLPFLPIYYNQSLGNINLCRDNPLFKDKVSRILLVGSGALGNPLALIFSYYGIDFDNVDPDKIELTNLARQILFNPEDVGYYKAERLTQRCLKLNPKLDLRHRELKIHPDTDFLFGIKPGDYDAVFCAVDKDEARSYLNYLSHRTGIPIISGGTGWDGGYATIYIPGETACLNDQLNINIRAQREKERRLAQEAQGGCIDVSEPSIISSNLITAAQMMNVFFRYLAIKNNTSGIAKTHFNLRYVYSFPKALTPAVPIETSCNCFQYQKSLEQK
ncbi:MAG: ThiF family adenylyltransferase [archaeon]